MYGSKPQEQKEKQLGNGQRDEVGYTHGDNVMYMTVSK